MTMTGMHDRTYHQAVADAMGQPLTPTERLWLATFDREVRLALTWAGPAARGYELRRAAAEMVDDAARALANERERVARLSLAQRAALRGRVLTRLIEDIGATHRVAWRSDGDGYRGRFAPRDEPLGPGEEATE